MVKKLQNHGTNEMKDCGVQRISYICGAKDRVIEKKCVSLHLEYNHKLSRWKI